MAKSKAKAKAKPPVKASAKVKNKDKDTVKAKAGPMRPAPAHGYLLDEQIGFRLRRAHQRATVIFNDLMADFDVTPTQFAALAKLSFLTHLGGDMQGAQLVSERQQSCAFARQHHDLRRRHR